MNRRPRSTRALIPLALLASGCRVFDPSLYMDVATDTGADASADVAPVLALAETCNAASIPEATPGPDYLADTTALNNDVNGVDCIGSPLPGREGVFQVMMHDGEKWHFHVKVGTDTTAQPVVYVLTGCDERSCTTGQGIDECPAGKDEHITYVASGPGTRYIAIDSTVDNAGSPYHVLVVHVVCGDGVLQHSETCDHGTAIGTGNGDGTGCDSKCRYELTPALTDHTAELEPDDDFSDANVVRISDVAGSTGGLGTLAITGSLRTSCEYDTYVVKVPAGGAALSVAMSPVAGACTDVSTIQMTLLDTNHITPLAQANGDTTTPCPTLDTAVQGSMRVLPEGEYFVRITTATHVNPASSTTALNYRLTFTLSAP